MSRPKTFRTPREPTAGGVEKEGAFGNISERGVFRGYFMFLKGCFLGNLENQNWSSAIRGHGLFRYRHLRLNEWVHQGCSKRVGLGGSGRLVSAFFPPSLFNSK